MLRGLASRGLPFSRQLLSRPHPFALASLAGQFASNFPREPAECRLGKLMRPGFGGWESVLGVAEERHTVLEAWGRAGEPMGSEAVGAGTCARADKVCCVALRWAVWWHVTSLSRCLCMSEIHECVGLPVAATCVHVETEMFWSHVAVCEYPVAPL